MPVEHLTPDAQPDKIAEILARDGGVVIDHLTSPSVMDEILGEMDPFITDTQAGMDEFTGRHTRRTGALIARSPSAHELITHPSILGSAKALLSDASNFHIHLTQIISIEGGATPQSIHRDQWAFDFFPFPKGYEVQCNTIWAMTDFTEKNGATRMIPGSHLDEDRKKFKLEDSEPAEMEKGSVFIYTGAVYHGGGANQTRETRRGLNITYARSWLRQEENQYLSVPREIARTLPTPLLRLMGYARGAYALGYIDDLRDPINALEREASPDGLGDLEAAERILSGDATS